MNEAARTLRCWLLTAFLERGCDPLSARLPRPVPRVRPLSRAELEARGPRWENVAFLPRRPAPRPGVMV